MKKIISILLLLLCSTFGFTEENEIDELFEIKAEVGVAYPIFMYSDYQNDISVAPMYKLQIDFPIINNFGGCVSCNFFNYSLKNLIKISNLSGLTGVYYSFLLPKDWSITPSLQVGFTWEKYSPKNNRNTNNYSIASSLAVEFAKKIAKHWTVYGTTSLGYYFHSYPVSAGIGISYIVE